jgi:hypothetical protein
VLKTGKKEFFMAIMLDRADLAACWKFATDDLAEKDSEALSSRYVGVSCLKESLLLYYGVDGANDTMLFILSRAPSLTALPPKQGIMFDSVKAKIKFTNLIRARDAEIDVSGFPQAEKRCNPLDMLEELRSKNYIRGEANTVPGFKERVKAALGTTIEDLRMCPYVPKDALEKPWNDDLSKYTFWISPVENWEQGKSEWSPIAGRKFDFQDNKVICVVSSMMNYNICDETLSKEADAGKQIWLDAEYLVPFVPSSQTEVKASESPVSDDEEIEEIDAPSEKEVSEAPIVSGPKPRKGNGLR